MVIKGDTVQVPSLYPGRFGTASHSEGGGRWVIWRDTGGHWQAGRYDFDAVVFVEAPTPGQPRLKFDGVKTAVR